MECLLLSQPNLWSEKYYTSISVPCASDLFFKKTRYKGLINFYTEERNALISVPKWLEFLSALSLNIISGSCKSIAALSHLKFERVGSQRWWATWGFLSDRFTVHPRIEVVIIPPLSLEISLSHWYMLKLFQRSCICSDRKWVTAKNKVNPLQLFCDRKGW